MAADAVGARPNLVLLVGRTGAGKSSLANAMLGRKAFAAKRSMQSVTRVCSAAVASGDAPLVVVDTPGLCDTGGMSQSAVCDAIAEFVERPTNDAVAAAGGVAALFVVLNPLERAPPDLVAALRLLRLRLGARVMELATAVFTHADVLADDGITTAGALVQDAGPDAAELVAACKGGGVLVDARLRNDAAWWERGDLADLVHGALRRCHASGGPARVAGAAGASGDATLAAARVASDAADALRGALSDASLFNANGVAADPMFAKLDAAGSGSDKGAAQALDNALSGVLAMVRGHAAGSASRSDPQAPNLAAMLQRTRAGERAIPRVEWDVSRDLAGTFAVSGGGTAQLSLEGVCAGLPELRVNGELRSEGNAQLEVGRAEPSAGGRVHVAGGREGASLGSGLALACDARGYALQLCGPLTLEGPAELRTDATVRDSDFLDEGVYRVDLRRDDGEASVATLMRTPEAAQQMSVLVGVPVSACVSVPPGSVLRLGPGASLTVAGSCTVRGSAWHLAPSGSLDAVGYLSLATAGAVGLTPYVSCAPAGARVALAAPAGG